MHKAHKIKTFLSLGFLALGLLLISRPAHTLSSAVHFIQLEDQTINPVTAEYIIKAIDQAEAENAQALVLKLDTPGGLLSSTRLIVKRMLQSEVPLVVYVAPGGSRAGSAGVFITYASHIAAMAPSTNIGAAHPVTMGPSSPKPKGEEWQELKKLLEDLKASQENSDSEKSAKEEKKSEEEDEPRVEEPEALAPDRDPMGSKILQDTVAFIKAIAAERGRNVEWGVESVAKSASITDEEAFEKEVVEIIAVSDRDLLEQLDGRRVQIREKEITLQTKDAAIQYTEMSQVEKFFNILADPNIAYFLMILGFYGLMFEVTHPGFGVPGILGSVFLILAFYSMQTLPTNYAGVALVGLGLILLIAEVYTPTFGLLSLGGLAALVLGSLLLFDSVDPIMRVSRAMIFTAVGTAGGLTFLVLAYMVKGQRRKVKGGQEGLIGEKGTVQHAFSAGKEGKIFIHGEIWNAACDEDLAEGDHVMVREVSGMLLRVKRIVD